MDRVHDGNARLTATSRAARNRASATSDIGSSIWLHSSISTIAGRPSPQSASSTDLFADWQVVPITACCCSWAIRPLLLPPAPVSLISSFRVCCTAARSFGCNGSLNIARSSLSAFSISPSPPRPFCPEVVATHGSSTLAIFFSEPTRRNSVKPASISPHSTSAPRHKYPYRHLKT
jgi:hypothetical protein